ncbi:hypothetical protein L915_13199 [Phytophthora nicotianae]|uniref:Uncharacterized protein n=1 Tax=Phytophthora nicotianae TaxID=4792 RepID=W2GE70_PHYNI|nr:hypothetical protein L915_13199 [Phytophthora nicotianae]
MRELIRLKPFSAKRGTTGHVLKEVAKGVSSAIQVQLNIKQVCDRLNLLKAKFELSSARASGVEEDLHAVNIQCHYNDLNGLARDYVELERMYLDEKKAKNRQRLRSKRIKLTMLLPSPTRAISEDCNVQTTARNTRLRTNGLVRVKQRASQV